MGARFFDKVILRAHSAVVPNMADGEGVTEYLASFAATVTMASLMEKAKINIDPEGQDPLGDGTLDTFSEKFAIDFTALMTYTEYTALQTLIFGALVDASYIDSDDEELAQGGIPYAAGVRLAAKVLLEGANRFKVQVTGGKISQQAINFWQLIVQDDPV